MELIVFKKSKAILEIEERFKTNTLAFKISIDEKYEKPTLIDGSTEIIGLKAINAYIDNFENEKQQWYYCNC
jgi:hypothetical protein